MISNDTLKVLADVGFMASGTGLPKHAFGIFNGIEVARPDSPISTIGFAMEFMNRKRHNEAIQLLQTEGLAKYPKDPTVKAFLGMALMFAGRNSECEQCLQDIVGCNDEQASTMAKELLTQLHGG